MPLSAGLSPRTISGKSIRKEHCVSRAVGWSLRAKRDQPAGENQTAAGPALPPYARDKRAPLIPWNRNGSSGEVVSRHDAR